jgi:hypothetical protein
MMDLLTYKILNEFQTSHSNWDSIKNLVNQDPDLFGYSVVQARERFDRLLQRKMIASIGIGNACEIKSEGRKLYSSLQQQFGFAPTPMPSLVEQSGKTVAKTAKWQPPFLFHHTHKYQFFTVIEQRLAEYAVALQSRSGASLALHFGTCRARHLEQLKRWDNQSELFSGDFWGYGINHICDGITMFQQPDVQEIKSIGGLNKIHEPYRNFQLLSFRIENDALMVSTFKIDTGSVNSNANLKTPVLLKDFSYAKKVIYGQKIFVEFHFSTLPKPISFQVETYHLPGDTLNHEQLAEYYVQGLTAYAKLFIVATTAAPSTINFLADFINGIKELQEAGSTAECIKIHRNKARNEGSFRDWFRTWFRAKGYFAEAEPVKDEGRIDLKVVHRLINNKIIEFKGWWNSDKKEIIQQICKYLTEFEQDGYVFIVNHTKTNIKGSYERLVTTSELGYITGSWREIQHENSSYTYYASEHNTLQGKKTIYHFIFPIYSI